MAIPMLTRKSALLVGLEATYDTLPALSGATDSVLIDNITFTPDMQVLERKFLHPSLSRLRSKIGRRLAKLKFSVELSGNGLQNVGTAASAPVIGRLLRACAMRQVANAAGWVTPAMLVNNTGSPAVGWVNGVGAGTPISDATGYSIIVTASGPSGSAKASIIPHDLALDTPQTNVTITSGVAMNVGSHALTITPTFAGNLLVGTSWFVVMYPAGLAYTPVSNLFESVSLKFYVDGSVHAITGAMGTVNLKADAGNYASLEFDFMGRYNPYADEALPSVSYSELDPPVFQKAAFILGTYAPEITSFTVDLGVTVTPRESANSADGYLGMLVTARDAKGGCDPEATSAASDNFWDTMASATALPVMARFGNQLGNRFSFLAPSAQFTGVTYKDRNGIRAHDIGLAFNQVQGDDEILLYAY